VREVRHRAGMSITAPESASANPVPHRRSSVTLRNARSAAEMTSWREEAACRGTAHGPFFQNGLRPRSMYERCASCSVRDVCLWVALAYEARAGFHHGVWGGTVPEMRARIAAELSDLEIADRLLDAIDASSLAHIASDEPVVARTTR